MLSKTSQVVDKNLLQDECFAFNYAREVRMIANDRREENPLEYFWNNSSMIKKINWLLITWKQKRDVFYLNSAMSYSRQGISKIGTRATSTVKLYKRWMRMYGEPMTVFLFRKKLGIKLPAEVVETKEIKHAI